jgi:antitoxin component YwqK of YwqJK toxin-antitoxin module
MEKILNQYIDEFRKELDEIKSDYFKFEFNTSQLPDYVEYTYPNKDIRTHIVFQEMFNSLENLKTNCLYWFSVNTKEEAKKLKQLISDNKSYLWSEDKTKCRALPARNENDDSTVIYVGVRKGSIAKKQKITNISGRMVQHLGYYKEGRTQGLQLAYYANSLDIDLTLHVYSLIDCPDEYLYILEKIFAKKLKPISGKH